MTSTDRATAEKERETVVLQLLPRARSLVRYLVHGDCEVEDIVQEALIALMNGLPTYRGEGRLNAWADRVVARTTFCWLRRMRCNRAPESHESEELGAVPSPDAPLDEYVHRQHLVKLLDSIPNEQRHALVLHHVLELSVLEIASEFSVPLETVRSRLRLGRAALRTLAEKEDSGGTIPHGLF
jgi:RNA polymerase sigma-70 factor (ECF subfamily)